MIPLTRGIDKETHDAIVARRGRPLTDPPIQRRTAACFSPAALRTATSWSGNMTLAKRSRRK